MIKFRQNPISAITSFLLVLLLASTVAFAAGSDEKEPEQSPEAKKQETLQSAAEHYNTGVGHMTTAKEKAAIADSTFAFNYRATSDAKAKREYKKAVGEFKKAINLQPDMAEAHNNLGYCYRKLGSLDESLKHYHRALKIDSTFEQAREYLGETYLAMDSLLLATSQYDWLIENKSVYADTLAESIKLYRLKHISEKMQGGKEK